MLGDAMDEGNEMLTLTLTNSAPAWPSDGEARESFFYESSHGNIDDTGGGADVQALGIMVVSPTDGGAGRS